MEICNKLNWLVECTLNLNSVSAEYKVICLDEKEFKEFQYGNRAFLQLIVFFSEENFDIFFDIFQEYPDYIAWHIEDVESLLKSFKREYGRLLSLDGLAYSEGACIKLDDLSNTDGFTPFEVIKDIFPIFFDILDMKKDVDFAIVLPKERFMGKRKPDKLTIITHEAYHIVEHKIQKFHAKGEIDKKVTKIINECQRRKYEPLL